MGQYVLNPKTNKYEWQASTKTINTPGGTKQVASGPNLFQQLGAFTKNLNLDAKARNTAANRPTVVTSTELQEKGYTYKNGQWTKPPTTVGPSATQLAGYSPVDYRAAIDPVTGVIDYTKLVVPGKKTETETETETEVGTETKKPYTPLFSPTELLNRQTDLANQLRTYQDQLANTQSAADRRALAQNIRKTELAFQQARQQISEQDFMQQRSLIQGAQARGLGGSGLEQLGRTQARMQTGQQLNQLSQQYGDQLQGYLNAQLGIEENLANALSGNALTELGNINEAELNALNQQWTQQQQAWTIEEREKFDNQETAQNFIDLYQSLKEVGDNSADRTALKEAYKDKLPQETIDELFGMSGTDLSMGEASSRVASNIQGVGFAGAADRQKIAEAKAKDTDGDGKLSRLRTGNTNLYFSNDKELLVYVKNLYTNRENSDKINVKVVNGKIVYVTPDNKTFTTYNKASNALG
jgi:hypothetical protein